MTVEEQLLLNTMTAECTRLHKAIENIKAEVNNDMHKAVQVKNPNTDFAFGLQHALDIINKHTKGELNENT